MKGISKILLMLGAVFFMAGCASILSKSMYPVTINSYPDEANIVIKDERGMSMYKGRTPATLTLAAGEAYFHAKSYTVTFSKAGYEEQTAVIKSGLDGWYIGNILFGGLIGVLIVDPLTGAMWSLPKELIVTLAKKDLALNKNERALRIVSIDQIPDNLKNKLVRLK
jgi:hypothetical protein